MSNIWSKEKVFFVFLSILFSTNLAFANRSQIVLDSELIQAVQNGNLTQVKTLIQEGASPNNTKVPDLSAQCKTQYHYPAIHLATRNYKILSYLVENSKANLNLVSDVTLCGYAWTEKLSPLMFILEHFSDLTHQTFEYLVSNGANPNLTVRHLGWGIYSALTIVLKNLHLYPYYSDRLLELANNEGIRAGFEYLTSSNSPRPETFEKINFLMPTAKKLKTNLNIYNDWYDGKEHVTFLDMLLRSCSDEALRLIDDALSLEANPISKYGKPIISILSCSDENFNLRKLGLLKNHKLNLSPENFIRVLEYSQINLAESLLIKEPIPADLFKSALWWDLYPEENYHIPAISRISLDAMKLLIQYGADLQSTFGSYYPQASRKNYDPLKYLIMAEGGPKIGKIKLLLDAGIDSNTRTPDKGDTAFILASMTHDEDIIDILLAYHAKPDLVNFHNSSALFALTASINPRKIPSEALFKKVISLNRDIINVVSSDGNFGRNNWSALHELIAEDTWDYSENNRESEFLRIVDFFLKSGADKDVTDDLGRTPMDLLSEVTGISEEFRGNIAKLLK